MPLVVGGRSEAALRRAGRLGDGWLGIWTTAQRCAEAIRRVEEHAISAGRRDVSWRHGMTFWCGFGDDRAQARDRVAPVMEGLYRLPFDKFERFVPYGPPEQVAEFVTPFVEPVPPQSTSSPSPATPRRGSTRWPTCESRF